MHYKVHLQEYMKLLACHYHYPSIRLIQRREICPSFGREAYVGETGFWTTFSKRLSCLVSQIMEALFTRA